jgi:hypothetical protein
MSDKPMIIAVDFDGTCVEHEYPKVGADVPGAVQVLRRLRANGHKLILWTMRSDSDEHTPLTDAVNWFKSHSIELFGVNNNPTQHGWTQSPKAYAQIYIDDAALGCPLRQSPKMGNRPIVDWEKVAAYFWGEGQDK